MPGSSDGFLGSAGLRGLVAVVLLALPGTVGAPYTDAKPLRFTGSFDPFKVLDLPRSKKVPPSEDVRKAFKKAALKWHPDRCNRRGDGEDCEAKMEEVKLAQEVLSDSRKLQQWEAWREDKVLGNRGKQRGGFGGGQRGSFSGAPPAPPSPPQRESPFSSFGFDDIFGGGRKPRKPQNAGAGGRRAAKSPPPPPPPPPSPKKSSEGGPWKEVSKENVKRSGVGGARVETVTRERDIAGTKMVQVEVVERTCYKAQAECQEKVLERWRRRREEL